ncbi:MAG: hypothetical protein HC892_01635 [Saprospiraceae bacterium]|nr:hypothetical protein [Saprospiraceae bacterium]
MTPFEKKVALVAGLLVIGGGIAMAQSPKGKKSAKFNSVEDALKTTYSDYKVHQIPESGDSFLLVSPTNVAIVIAKKVLFKYTLIELINVVK